MAVKIRLSRAGKKKAPFHTVVVADSRKKRDGAIIENIGTFDGLNGKVVLFNEVGYQQWIKVGAQPTDSVKKIYKLYKSSQQPEAAVISQPKKVRAKKEPKSTDAA